MKKNVWIMNHYATGTFFQKGGRHYWFAKFLKQSGYDPVVFCCNTKHGASGGFFEFAGIWTERLAEEIQVPFVVVKAREYQGNGKQRVLNMLDFYVNVKKAAKEYAEIHGRPDVILASSVHPLTLLAGIQLAKHFGVKCICEIRDLWPESIVTYISAIKKDSFLAKAMYCGERYLYKSCDSLLFTFEGGYDYITEKKWNGSIPRSKVFYINNGIDLEEFEANKGKYTVDDDDLNNKEYINIVYTGSIRRVNNLDLLIDAAKCVTNEKTRFLVWGDGDQLERLKKRICDENVGNVVFKGSVDKKYIPYIVSMADFCFAHNEATEMDYKYGISFNKIFDYMAGGKPVLCDFPCRFNPVIQENAGIEVTNPRKEDIAEMIDRISEMNKDQYLMLCQNAMAAAKKYDFRVLVNELIRIIEIT